MNTLIVNRETFQMPSDGWYQLSPLGEFPHAGAGVVQVVDPEACTAMTARFKADASVANFAGLLVDFDHFSLDDRARSEAAGWIVEMECRLPNADCRMGSGVDSTTKVTKGREGGAGPAVERNAPGSSVGHTAGQAHCGAGLWVNIRWSDVGEEAVKGGRYRFLSPVWARSDCIDLGPSTGSGHGMQRVRPVRLLNAAVTNDPNLKGMCPLCNNGQDRRPSVAKAMEGKPETLDLRPNAEEETGMEVGPVDSCACNRQGCGRAEGGDLRPEFRNGEKVMKRVMEKLVNHLGLPGDATEDAILEKMQGLPGLTAVTDLQNSLKKAQDERDALKADLQNSVKQAQADRDALQGKLKGAEDELVNRHLAEFECVMSEATKPFWAEQLLKNRQAALAALGDIASLRAAEKDGGTEGDGKPASATGKDGSESGHPSASSGQVRKPLHNRATARPVIPGIATGAPQSGAAESKAVKIRNRAHEIAKGEGVAFSTAFRRAEKEICEQ